MCYIFIGVKTVVVKENKKSGNTDHCTFICITENFTMILTHGLGIHILIKQRIR